MKAIETALSLTQAYKLGIERFEKMLGEEFSKAIDVMNKTNEHIIICGMGKSGLVGRKILGVPVEARVDDIFLPTSPDFPIPQIIICSLVLFINSIALEKSSPSIFSNLSIPNL